MRNAEAGTCWYVQYLEKCACMASQKEESVPRVATPTALDTPRQCDESSMPRASDELDAVYESLVLQGKLDAELDLGRPACTHACWCTYMCVLRHRMAACTAMATIACPNTIRPSRTNATSTAAPTDNPTLSGG
jgi:hypothetical protein